MALPVSRINVSYNDNTLNQKTGKPENAGFSFNIATLTAGNIVAQLGLWTTFRSAISDIILGLERQESVVALYSNASNSRPSDVHAQRENKWLCRYHDTVNSKGYDFSIPTADIEQLPDGSEFLDLTSLTGAAFKSAFEALVVSPYDPAHSVVLDSVQFVGRNL